MMLLTTPFNFFWLLVHATPVGRSHWAYQGIEALSGAVLQSHFFLTAWLYSHAAIPALLWGAGTAAALLLLAKEWFATHLFLQQCIPAGSAQLAQLLLQAERKIGRKQSVPLVWSSEIDTHATAGILHPAIILPAGRLNGLSYTQLELLMLHELAHIQRRDALRVYAAKLAACFLFFHPAVWYTVSLLRCQCEECCDAMVVETSGARNAYVHTLAEIENRRSVQTTSVLAGNGGELLQRIRALIGKETAFPYPKLTQFTPAALLLFSALLLPPGAGQPAVGASTHTRMLVSPAVKMPTVSVHSEPELDGAADRDDIDQQDTN